MLVKHSTNVGCSLNAGEGVGEGEGCRTSRWRDIFVCSNEISVPLISRDWIIALKSKSITVD